jgi:hypothetical protein
LERKEEGVRADSGLSRERKRVSVPILGFGEKKRECRCRFWALERKEEGVGADFGLCSERKRVPVSILGFGEKEGAEPILDFVEKAIGCQCQFRALVRKQEGVGPILGFGEKA